MFRQDRFQFGNGVITPIGAEQRLRQRNPVAVRKSVGVVGLGTCQVLDGQTPTTLQNVELASLPQRDCIVRIGLQLGRKGLLRFLDVSPHHVEGPLENQPLGVIRIALDILFDFRRQSLQILLCQQE